VIGNFRVVVCRYTEAVPDFMSMLSRGSGRKVLRAGIAALALTPAVAALPAPASAQPAEASAPASAQPGSASTPPIPTTTLPAIPKVSGAITDGQSAQSLLATAIELSAVGIDTSAFEAAIAATQAKMDADASVAATADRAAAAADAEAGDARLAAQTATATLRQMSNAVKQAVIALYTDGPASLAVDPAAGEEAVFAQAYAYSALTPYGVLAQSSAEQGQRAAELQIARRAEQRADRARRKADRALAAERAEESRLVSELNAVSSASSAQVAADHLTLASQSAQELLSASSLQFTPKQPLPPPLATTPVALTWAFAELGKPYVWGATGPGSFDCSGLTQFVWRAAGVSIPRVAADQYAWTVPVPLSQLLPGDLVFYGRTDIHHVGIYIGDGLMINAPHTGTVVQVSSIWWSDLAGFGRVHDANVPVPPHPPPSASSPAAAVVVAKAGPVPSQTKPPKGWKPGKGKTSPIASTTGSTSGGSSSTTTSTTAAPGSSTTSSTSSTTASTQPTVTLPATTVPGSSTTAATPASSS
jgi:cell wall-associated NlpC family hydrolase